MLLRFAADLAVGITSNQAERNIRPVKVAQPASGRAWPIIAGLAGSPSSAPSCPPPGSGVQDHFSL
jgi:hypothetical protein